MKPAHNSEWFESVDVLTREGESFSATSMSLLIPGVTCRGAGAGVSVSRLGMSDQREVGHSRQFAPDQGQVCRIVQCYRL